MGKGGYRDCIRAIEDVRCDRDVEGFAHAMYDPCRIEDLYEEARRLAKFYHWMGTCMRVLSVPVPIS